MNRGHWILFGTMAAAGAVGGLLSLFAVTPSKEENKGGDNSRESSFGHKKGSPIRQRVR
ncbi:hypothetical protein D3C80_1831910 [compost metagenome]